MTCQKRWLKAFFILLVLSGLSRGEAFAVADGVAFSCATNSSNQVVVTMTCATPPSCSNIRWGSNTSPAISTRYYTGPVTITSARTIYAIAHYCAWGAGCWDVTTYLEIKKLSTPSISYPAKGGGAFPDFIGYVDISVSLPANANQRYYWIDPGTPTTTYSAPVRRTSSLNQFSAIAKKTNQSSSSNPYYMPSAERTTGAITVGLINLKFLDENAAVTSKIVQIAADPASALNGATIRYTTDGSTPSLTNGSNYSSGFTIYQTTTVKAKAYKNGYAYSNLKSGVHEILVEQPTLASGSTTDIVGVGSKTIFFNPISGATIHYSIDLGQTEVYTTSGITIEKNSDIEAYATKPNLSQSLDHAS